MINSKTKICLVLPTREEQDLFIGCLALENLRNITMFTSCTEAFDTAQKQKFDLFIVRMEMPDMNGLVFLQKLRSIGRYGREVFVFVSHQIQPSILSLLSELDIIHVISKQPTKQMVSAKLKHMVQLENSITEDELLYRDGRSALASSNYQEASKIADKILASSVPTVKSLLLKADVARSLNDDAGMEKYYNDAFNLDPKSAVAAHKLAYVWMRQGQYLKAANLLNSLSELNSYNIEALENSGLSNLQIKNYAAAQGYADRLGNIDTNNPVASEITVENKIAKGDWRDLGATLKKSHSEKDIVVYLSNAAVRLAKAGDIQGGLQLLENSMDQVKESKFVYAFYYNLGALYRESSALKKAIKYFEKALELNPDFDRARTALKETQETLTKAISKLGKLAS